MLVASYPGLGTRLEIMLASIVACSVANFEFSMCLAAKVKFSGSMCAC